MRDHVYFVYMLASGHHGTLYIGVTNDLLRRVSEHREGLVPGFTRRYGVKWLVWYEQHVDIRDAIVREKKLKRWRRDWKIALLEADNRHWSDLYPVLAGNGSRVCGAPFHAAPRTG
jgi:putative endonuclease